MVARSFPSVRNEGKEVLNVKLIINNIKQISFRAIPKIAYKGDPSGVLSMVPPKVLMIQDAWCFHT